MSHFTDWYQHNSREITWFVIGWLVAFGISDLTHGQWAWAVINFGLALVNYLVRER